MEINKLQHLERIKAALGRSFSLFHRLNRKTGTKLKERKKKRRERRGIGERERSCENGKFDIIEWKTKSNQGFGKLAQRNFQQKVLRPRMEDFKKRRFFSGRRNHISFI